MSDANLEPLLRSELLSDFDADQAARVAAIARTESVAAGKYLFLLGERADRLYVVLSGRIETCLPLTLGGAMRDLAVDTLEPGQVLGLSAFVRPHKFTLSARAAAPTELATLDREELRALLAQDPVLGHQFHERLSELIGARFLTIQALWARDLQRAVAAGWTGAEAEANPA